MFVVSSSQGDKCLGWIISRWANKMNRKREKKCIQSDQPAWKPGGALVTPQSRKIPVFDCAVALCTMQNELLVIRNLTWPIVPGVFPFSVKIRSIAQNGILTLVTVLLTRYGKVGWIQKYPMVVWTHHFSCCETSILLSVFNSYLFVELKYAQAVGVSTSTSLSYWCSMVVLKTCNEVMPFISVIPSEIRRFKFMVSRLCDDHTAAYNLRD
jgi:hypothetical protein